ncbi:ATP-dependent helicase/nuclease subunit A [Ligilactobacillus pabuli]|uniref:ATP-dependent helicase/nuclease subunit A n=1 Tax=Ligilactobacillus pabuli TaxID=2886039 RepID=A0ABQ5JGE3_9LACO|nr:helicase-exonuclease AddAB subunit AddA [Ligilactobacillus pabuli]GKS80923.1 ATP-dependent helicase/nuclease subunit A [Ligilactobacillus pabuli]
MSTEKKSGFEPTPGQYKAINHRGHDVLVAASAGSGKTKVLIERVLKQVVEQHVDLSSMLIVTFTEAAAKEMRDRLAKQLQQKLAQLVEENQPESQSEMSWLRQQLLAVNVADISTIHAFCLHLIQKYYYTCDIEPDFRLVSDDTERTLLRDDAWDTVRERYYQQLEDSYQTDNSLTDQQRADAQLFEKLLQIFAKDRDDANFSELVLRADEFASATSDPTTWLLQLSRSYAVEPGQDFTTSVIWQSSLKEMLTVQLDEIVTNLERRNELYSEQLRPEIEEYWENEVSEDLTGYAKKKKDHLANYAEKAQIQKTELQTLQDLRALILHGDNYSAIKEMVGGFKLAGRPALAKPRSQKSPGDLNTDHARALNDQMKAYQEAAKKQLEHFIPENFALTNEQLVALMNDSEKLLVKFGEIVVAFREEYHQEKAKRHLLDFNDLEHYALQIVASETPESQQIRGILQERYSEIMVDEYQDTNGVQEALLTTIKNPEQGNMFMVGDVKQSIYRFRQADPALFNRKYHDFAEAETGELPADQPGEKIILAENFRSVENVADLTNLIFSQVMDEKIGEISYDENASLKAGNLSYPAETAHLSTDVLVYESKEKEDTDETENELSFEIDSKEQGQIYLVAHKIKQLKEEHKQIFDRDLGQMRDLDYKDIAILASTHGDSLLIAEEFKNLEIPVNVDNTNNYFKTIEIQIMMGLLQVIDNPHQDIPLVAVLRSPLYQFDENQLAQLRINLKHGDFYATLTDYHYQINQKKEKDQEVTADEQSLFEKVEHFLNDLTSFRVRGRRNDLPTLIWSIYSRTGFLDYAGGMPGGKQRQANLHALYERAADYEQMSYKGIFQFVRFIKKMQEEDHDLAEMNVQDGNNAVSFMTIHKSKGLEYPVVFLINTHKRFNLRSLSNAYVLDAQLGMGIDYVQTVTEDGRQIQVKTPTPVKTAIKEKAQQKAIAEEMRKLYVALTRAEQKIYLVGESKDAATALENWVKLVDADRTTLSDAQRKKTGANYLDWVGASLLRSQEFTAANIHRYCLDEKNSPFTQEGLEFLADDEDNDASDLVETIETLQASAPAAIKNSAAQFKIEFWDQARVEYEIKPTQEQETKKAAEWLERQAQGGQLPPKYAQLLEFKYPNTQLTLTTAYQSVTDIKRLFEDPDNDLMGQMDIDQLDQAQRAKKEVQQATYLQHGFERPLFMLEEENVTPAQIGTATHLVFQKLPLDAPVTLAVVQSVIDDLCAQELLSQSLADKINVAGVVGLYESELGQKILHNRHQLHREAPVAMLYPAGKLFGSTTSQTEYPVLIHGIIDGYFTTDEQTTVLFDYKTDHVPAGGAAQVAEKYRGQLNLYALALESILGPGTEIEKYIYLVDTSQVVAL